eukprot:118911_1
MSFIRVFLLIHCTVPPTGSTPLPTISTHSPTISTDIPTIATDLPTISSSSSTIQPTDLPSISPVTIFNQLLYQVFHQLLLFVLQVKMKEFFVYIWKYHK